MQHLFKIIFIVIISIIHQNSFSQNDPSFCKAVSESRFKKVERIFKRQVKKLSEGYTYSNQDNGWGIATSYYTNYSSLVNWLKKQDAVEDAFWDKCQTKEAIYPGHSTIGVIFKTKAGLLEKCFLMQEGTTGQVNIFGWRPKLLASKKLLVYNKLFDCNNFIEQQKINCQKLNKSVQ